MPNGAPDYGSPEYINYYNQWKARQDAGIETGMWLAPPGYWGGVPYIDEFGNQAVYSDSYTGSTPYIPSVIKNNPTPIPYPIPVAPGPVGSPPQDGVGIDTITTDRGFKSGLDLKTLIILFSIMDKD